MVSVSQVVSLHTRRVKRVRMYTLMKVGVSVGCSSCKACMHLNVGVLRA